MPTLDIKTLPLTRKTQDMLREADRLVDWYQRNRPDVDFITLPNAVVSRLMMEANSPKVPPPATGGKWSISDLRYRRMQIRGSR